jgi:hypothetical protein
MPDGRRLISVGNGFCLLEEDFDEIVKGADEIVGLWKSRNRKMDRVRSSAIRLGQLLKASLFPAQTATFGYYEEKTGQPFHMERYKVIKGE